MIGGGRDTCFTTDPRTRLALIVGDRKPTKAIAVEHRQLDWVLGPLPSPKIAFENRKLGLLAFAGPRPCSVPHLPS